MIPCYEINWGVNRLRLGESPRVIGIVNVTPDSFSDGGKFFDPEAAVAQGLSLALAGADILDIGGESTRPFSDPVSAEEEIRRVVPVIETLFPRIRIPISVDTTKAAVARAAIAAGASMVNDVSALRFDPEMATVVREAGIPVVLMHMLGTPKTMQQDPVYPDVVRAVFTFLEDAVHRALNAGIPETHIIADPGIGFGKTVTHNLTLIAELQTFHSLGVPILVGPSRKAFIRTLLREESGREIHPDTAEVEAGTQTVVTAAVLNGAHIIRVHNVENTRKTIRIADAIFRARQPSTLGTSAAVGA